MRPLSIVLGVLATLSPGPLVVAIVKPVAGHVALALAQTSVDPSKPGGAAAVAGAKKDVEGFKGSLRWAK